MEPFLYSGLYIVAAFAVVFFSIKLSDYVDLLDKKTNVSGAFLGGILLAAITSLPELFTSITATLVVGDNHLVLGNILGSNLFNMALFFIIFAVFVRKMVQSKVNKCHLVSIYFIGALYAVVAIASYVFDFNGIIWGWFNPMSILVVAVYALSVIKTPKEEAGDDSEESSKLTVKQIIVRFIIFAVLLVAASIALTILVDKLNEIFSLGSSFGGALFLGVATSLPEMTATINLGRKGNFNAAIGDLVGSCVFNFIILAFADVLSFNCRENGEWVRVYQMDQSSFVMLVLGAFSLLVLFVTVLLSMKGKLQNRKAGWIVYIASGTLVVLSYIAFLVLSNVNLNLSFAPMSV